MREENSVNEKIVTNSMSETPSAKRGESKGRKRTTTTTTTTKLRRGNEGNDKGISDIIGKGRLIHYPLVPK